MELPAVTNLLENAAMQLSLTYRNQLAGGEFGACLVTDGTGAVMVLKALPFPDWAARWARAARLVDRLRATGYPAPRYIDTGATDDFVWSLQELMPGDVPTTPEPAHIDQLVVLASRHADLAPHDSAWLPEKLESIRQCCFSLLAHDATAHLAESLLRLLERHAGIDLIQDGIVHGDFHHRNYLARGQEVVGVFDWEGARSGDWRSDLANLVVVVDAPTAADALRRVCSPELAAIFVSLHLSRYLEYDSRTRPDQLERKAARAISRLAPWWESVL
jgi:aminoglycoside phosphotransferase (APT) family kinase protein